MEWMTRGRDPQQGKWLVLFGSSLLMLGSGVALIWSCIAFHLFPSMGSTSKAPALSCYSSSVWPVLLYAVGALVALPAGSLLDNKLGPRIPCVWGSCISFIACIGGSFAVHSMWNILLSLGFLNGAGFGLLLFPAGTVALRWDARSCNEVSAVRGTAFMAGFLFFAPMSMSMMAARPTILEEPHAQGAQLSPVIQPLDRTSLP